MHFFFFFFAGSCGVPDMTSISDIDEDVINRNLQIRYSENHIYVSFFIGHDVEKKKRKMLFSNVLTLA